MRPNPQSPADLLTFNEKILDGNFIFCVVIYFRTASIIFASTLMIMKHLLTTYFTFLPIKTKEWHYWTKSKVLIVALSNWVMVLWQKFSYLEITLLVLFLIPSFQIKQLITSYLLEDLMTHFNSRIICKKHHLTFLLTFLFFYFWNDLVYLSLISLD